MMAATILAIFFIPVSFEVVEKFGAKLSGKKHEPQPGIAGLKRQEAAMTKLKTICRFPRASRRVRMQGRPELLSVRPRPFPTSTAGCPDASTAAR